MPANLYGPNDNFDPETSHVLPALIRKFHNAKIKKTPVEIWGTGKPKRELLHADDLADAVVFIITLKEKLFSSICYTSGTPLINIGFGKEISIKELAGLIKEVIGFEGRILFDNTRPDGTLLKLLDSSKITSLGWKPKITLRDGIKSTYEWCLKEGTFLNQSHNTDRISSS